jgi:hypothetical protein
MKSGNVLLAAIAGVAVGEGTVTRRRIAKKGSDFADGVKEQFNEYVDNVTQQFDAIIEKAVDLVDMGGEKEKSNQSRG